MAFLDSLNKLLGDPNERELKKVLPLVRDVRACGEWPEIRGLTLEALPERMETLKRRVQDDVSAGRNPRAVLDRLLPETFATVIRACELIRGKTARMGKQEFIWDMVPFDVQILGGIVLHRGMIAEMKTGEGKTLVCTMPVVLNTLLGCGVHVVTVNDYLAGRDALWMGMLYRALGLSVGVVVHGLSTAERRSAYACDITYGTNNEFGFDYLRDNMAASLARQVQRGLHYAIVDEVDSILVDEARTPLIISQPAEESTLKYGQYAQLVSALQENVHYVRDEKQRTAVLTEEGIRRMEELLGIENIYTERGFEEVHHIEQALRAHAIYKRDVDYVVTPSADSGQGTGQIVIVDEFTGRLMPGRRYSHGLHQAIEAKEGVEVQRESRTLATITFQNYFRLYGRLAGMTGTAKTEEEEFESIYRLRVIVIPTHRPMIRADKPDAVYRTMAAKFTAVAKIAEEKHHLGQPVLIGTTSIEKSEVMSALLQERAIPHQVLNAKQHEKEAEIVAHAGKRSSITIATNMAGRGTDIKLGEGVQELGGLCILGTERHEARRIDNQLRGRSGRQGDRGESQFFVSMEDELMRLFGGDRLKTMMKRLNVPDDMPLENAMVSRSIESAQKKVEGHHFDMRRHVLQYDDVMNKHREIIYKRRQKILEKIAESEKDSGPLHVEVLASIRNEATIVAVEHAADDDPERWDIGAIAEAIAALHEEFARKASREVLLTMRDLSTLGEFLTDLLVRFYEEKCADAAPEAVARAESLVTLRAIDAHWMDHIDDMSHLREQVAFSGFAQRDPLIEYQDQGFQRFAALIRNIESTIVRMLLQANFAEFAEPQVMAGEGESEDLATNETEIESQLTETGVTGVSLIKRTPPSYIQKVGRNDSCPCGAKHPDGRPKKYKHCHGK